MSASILTDRDILLHICVRCDDATLEKLALLGLWEVMLSFMNSSQLWAGLIVSRLTPHLTFNPIKDYRKTYSILACMKEGRPRGHIDSATRYASLEEMRQVHIGWMQREESAENAGIVKFRAQIEI